MSAWRRYLYLNQPRTIRLPVLGNVSMNAYATAGAHIVVPFRELKSWDPRGFANTGGISLVDASKLSLHVGSIGHLSIQGCR